MLLPLKRAIGIPQGRATALPTEGSGANGHGVWRNGSSLTPSGRTGRITSFRGAYAAEERRLKKREYKKAGPPRPCCAARTGRADDPVDLPPRLHRFPHL